MGRRLAFVVALLSTVLVGVAAPAGAAGTARVVAAATMCHIYDPENITGSMFVNNQIVNGTWNYATGVQCPFKVADMALYEQLNRNGTKVDSMLKNFNGVARQADAILSEYHCAVCNGTWTFTWGQILKAPVGLTWASPPSGCITEQNGLYLACVQTTSVTL
jgi:hypothetical protein